MMNSKKWNILVLLLAILMTACTTKPTATTDNGNAADTLKIKIDSIGVALTLTLDQLPQDTLQQRFLANFVAKQMFATEDEEAAVQLPTYKCDLLDFLNICARQRWTELEEDTYQGFSNNPDPDGDGLTLDEMKQMAQEDSMSLSTYAITFCKASENDSLIIWTCDYDFYVHNTAHPSSGSAEAAFKKE